MPTPHVDEQDGMRFRAPTLEDAIALAESSLGARVRVVAANRIRRGGIGGFFASDLGVEVTVALDDETIEQALERLVAETAAEERQLWQASQPAPAARAQQAASSAVVDRPAPASTAAVTTLESLMPSAPPRTEPSTMVRVEQIIEELQTLTAAPLFGNGTTRFGGRRVDPPMPVDPPAAPAVEAVVDALADAIGVRRPAPTDPEARIDPAHTTAESPALRFQPSDPSAVLDQQVDQAVDAFVARARPVASRTAQPTVAPASRETAADESTAEMVDDVADDAADPAEESPARPRPPATHAAAEIDLVQAARPASSSPPSRRQVELAVAAADQLIDSLKREDGVKRLSVRVVLRTGDQREVEAEAEWEAS